MLFVQEALKIMENDKKKSGKSKSVPDFVDKWFQKEGTASNLFNMASMEDLVKDGSNAKPEDTEAGGGLGASSVYTIPSGNNAVTFEVFRLVQSFLIFDFKFSMLSLV